jgi:tRNA(Ile2) C34 agmatinyltransferase TiaS
VTSLWYVAIDDTDNLESIGTGRLARMLASRLEEEGLLSSTSITRHQLLVHPDIPYTSHNSSACIEGTGADAGREKLVELSRALLLEHFHEGANPGLCVCRAESVPPAIVALGRRAQREVLDVAAFDASLPASRLGLWWSGETGQGRIGAVSAVGLRSTGEDGRFIALPGIRDLEGTLRVAEIVSRSGTAAVETVDGKELGPDVAIDTRDWVRPALRGGRPVLLVREEDGRFVPADRRSKVDDG